MAPNLTGGRPSALHMGNLPPSVFPTRGRKAKNRPRVLPALTYNPKPRGVFLALHGLLWPVGWAGRSWALSPAVIQGPRLLPSRWGLQGGVRWGFQGPVQSGTQAADQDSVLRPCLMQGGLGDDVWGVVRVGEVAGSSVSHLGKLHLPCYTLPPSDTTCFPKWSQCYEIPLAAGGQWALGRVWLRAGEA